MTLSSLRTNNYLRQLKGSIFFKFGSIFCSFISMPLMIQYLGPERFGIWSTMLMLITWIITFDFGIGNGLKNKVSESLANNEHQNATSYISTAYHMVGAISCALFITILLVSFFVPWQSVFNTKSVPNDELRISILILSFFVLFNFVLSLVNQVSHGLQKSAVVTFGGFLTSLTALCSVIILYYFYDSSITRIVSAYGFALILSSALISILIFRGYEELRPIWKQIDFSKVSSLLSLGLRFLIIQVAVIIIFMTDKMIITQLLGPEHVTSYDVIFKLFSVFTIIHGLILVPLWPAYSNAYVKGDLPWVRQMIRKQLKIAFALIFGALCLVFLGPTVVRLWIGSEIKVEPELFAFFFGFILVSVWNNVFAYFVNSINKINLQVITSIFAAIINIPMSVYFISYLDLGVSGAVLATTLSLCIYAVFGPIQVLKLLTESARG